MTKKNKAVGQTPAKGPDKKRIIADPLGLAYEVPGNEGNEMYKLKQNEFHRFFDLPDRVQNLILTLLTDQNMITMDSAVVNKSNRTILRTRQQEIYGRSFHFHGLQSVVKDMLLWVTQKRKLDIRNFTIEMTDLKGETPIDHFITQGEVDVARLVATRGAGFDVNELVERNYIESNKTILCFSALHLAASKDQREIAQMLIFEANADKNLKDSRGWSALQWACSYGSTDLTRMLALHARCDVNSQDERGATALHYAAASGNFECPYILTVDAKADCSIGTVGGTTALMYAAVEGHSDVVRLIAKQPTANTNQRSNDGRSALHFACQNQGHAQAAAVLVMECGADVNILDRDGQTPLHFACSPFTAKAVDVLLQGGVNVLIADVNQSTALMVAQDELAQLSANLQQLENDMANVPPSRLAAAMMGMKKKKQERDVVAEGVEQIKAVMIFQEEALRLRAIGNYGEDDL